MKEREIPHKNEARYECQWQTNAHWDAHTIELLWVLECCKAILSKWLAYLNMKLFVRHLNCARVSVSVRARQAIQTSTTLNPFDEISMLEQILSSKLVSCGKTTSILALGCYFACFPFHSLISSRSLCLSVCVSWLLLRRMHFQFLLVWVRALRFVTNVQQQYTLYDSLLNFVILRWRICTIKNHPTKCK